MLKYTSRTYNTILSDINSNDNLVDKPPWWKDMLAGLGDMLSMAINAQANESFLETAFTEKAVDRLLALIDYQRQGKVTSSGIVLFDIKRTAVFPFTVLKADVVAFSQGSVSVASRRFEGLSDVVVSAVSDTGTRSGNNLTVSRVFTTGEIFRISGGSLPTPLVAGTDYYAIYVSDTTIKVASSRSNAYNGTYITLTGAGSGTIDVFSKAVTVYQQTSKSDVIIGRSDGTTEWQEFDLPDLDVLKTSVSLSINSLSWTRQDTLVYSTASDRHFKLSFKTDGTATIQFGNGTYGLIPPAFDIYATYNTGGGSEANISVKDRINIYAGSDSNFTGVSNPQAMTGGSDRETKETAKILAPILLKTRDRFVTIQDGEALTLGYGGIETVKINRNYYGINSCQVIIVPTGGGAPSTALKNALQAYLLIRSIMSDSTGGAIDIRVVDPTYATTAFTSSFKVATGYTFSQVKPFYELGVLMMISEKSNEIKRKLAGYGITDAMALINNYWSGTLGYTFVTSDQSAVQGIIENSTAPAFGQSIQRSDVDGVLDKIPGVDYLLITVPASFPVTFTSQQISTAGTITTTEIT